MSESTTMPRAEDVLSVGTRISWGAVFGGGLVAFGIYFILTLLGAAVGLAISDKVRPSSLNTAAVVWMIVTVSSALFVGGLMTSLFTVGENKVEAVFYGVIMWAFFVGLLLVVGAAGVHNGFHGIVKMTNTDQSTATTNWENEAREAGVSPEQIADWRKKSATDKIAANVHDPEQQKEIVAAATKIAWFAFGGAWLSMLAAALGAWMGAGPTFRVVRVIGATRIVTPS